MTITQRVASRYLRAGDFQLAARCFKHRREIKTLTDLLDKTLDKFNYDLLLNADVPGGNVVQALREGHNTELVEKLRNYMDMLVEAEKELRRSAGLD